LTKQQLPKNVLAVATDEAEAIEVRISSVQKRDWWRKIPDIPLREFVERQRARAQARHGRRARGRPPGYPRLGLRRRDCGDWQSSVEQGTADDCAFDADLG
jgi:hypothetical protein